MNWFPAFANLPGAWLFTLFGPLLIFYFLKLRRTRLEIPSLVLWQQVINDQRVNAPFQRFKKNILLYLQVALLLLLCLAAMQPFLMGNNQRSQNLPILIDRSASMGAIDKETGQTRLELVKEEVQTLIDNQLTGQKLMLIGLGNAATRLTDEFTDNRTILTSALANLEVEDVPSQFEEGLRVAEGLSQSVNIPKVRLYSDGNLPTRPSPTEMVPDPAGVDGYSPKRMAAVDFNLPFEVELFVVPAGGPNMGITAFNARRESADEWEVFARVEASETGAGQADVILLRNGKIEAEDRVILGPKESQRVVFKVPADQAATIEVQLKPQEFDSLAADNKAFLTLPVGRDLQVFCPETLPMFRHALSGIKGLILDPPAGGSTVLKDYDLVISEDLQDAQRQAGVSMFIGKVPTDLEKMIKVETGIGEVVDWARTAELLQHVQMKEVAIMARPQRLPEVTDESIEALGYEILTYTDAGPLILKRDRGAQAEFYFLVDPIMTTLPHRLAFPVMVNNLVNIALRRASLSELNGPTTGVLPPVNAPRDTTLRITNPLGQHREMKSTVDGVLDGVAAPHVGLYEIRDGSKLVQQIGTGLLNPTETSLFGVDSIKFKEIDIQAASSEKLDIDKPLWPKLAMGAFVLLLLEWWFFQKRPYTPPSEREGR